MTEHGSEFTTALIKRLQKATTLDRDIDFDIAYAIDWRYDAGEDCGFREYADKFQRLARKDNYPRYTASLDAALTLVGDFWLELAVYHEGVFGAHAWLHAPEHLVSSKMIVWGEAHLKPSQSTSFKNAHDLYPIAICVAALKAANKQVLSGR